MAFTDTFIKRPVLAICINLLILVIGLQSLRTLSIRQYPKTDNSAITIRTAYIGANADLVRGYITSPIERAVAGADGIDYLESASTQGLSTITARLKLNFDVNAALTQIQAKVAQVKKDLPPEAESSVIDVESADSRIASMYMSFYSDTLEQNQISDYLLRVVQPQISALQGVQKADILGARTLAMRVWLKPEKLSALHLAPTEVEKALRDNNFLAAIGSTKGTMDSINLVANADLKSVEEFKKLVVKTVSGTQIRLEDVADVVLGAETYDTEVRFDGSKATFMGVWPLPNANVVEVIERVREALPSIEERLPTGLKLSIAYDATNYVRNAIKEVTKTLIETIVIVIIVIFLFLGSLRSIFIPVVAIPLSLIGAVGLMAYFGFTINLLTLLAIVLAVGLVVDDAIVMLENIERHVVEGMTPFDAAIRGAKELVAPTIAMTITLATVYAPIAFQGGLTGTLFKEFALTLSGAVVISGFVALTLSPMMSSKILLSNQHQKPGRLKAALDSAFQRVLKAYESILCKALNFRTGVISFAAGVGLLVIPFTATSMKELAPPEDQGVVFSIIQASPNSTVDQTTIYTAKVLEHFKAAPEYRTSFQITNPTGGFSGALLKPWSERTRSAAQIQQDLFGKTMTVPGVRSIVVTPPALPGGSDFPIEMIITSAGNPEEIDGYANKIVGAAFASGRFMFADSDLKFDLPQSQITFDREKVSSLGLTLSAVSKDLGVLTGGNYVNRFSILGRSYKVIPLLERNARLNTDQLKALYVSGPKGELIPLSSIATIEHSTQPRSLNRFQQLNSAAITGQMVPGTTVDQALTIIENAAKEILPKDYVIDYRGESRQLRKEGSALLTTFILAIVLIFLVLASQFESFRDPFVILLGSVPLALAGALLFVFLGFTSLNIYSQVGLVTLVGLVAKNGILIVEFANHLQEQGIKKLQAAKEAALTRFRPVLMTSVATIMGHFPLILATGPGAGARNSIGIVLVSGMFIGTLFTLFVVPVLYTYIAKERSPTT
jgi:multidrug efflux pump